MKREDLVKALEKEEITVSEQTIGLAESAVQAGRSVEPNALIAEALKEDEYRSSVDIGNVLGKSHNAIGKRMIKMKKSGDYPDVNFLRGWEKSGAKSSSQRATLWGKDKTRVLRFCKRRDVTSGREIANKLHMKRQRVRGIVGELKTEQGIGKYKNVSFPQSREEKQGEMRKRMDDIADAYRKNNNVLVREIAAALGTNQPTISRGIASIRELQGIGEYADVSLPITKEELDNKIISKIIEDPHKTQGEIAGELGIHRETVGSCIKRSGGICKILKKYKIRPWELTRTPRFYWDVPKNREYFFTWMTAIQGVRPMPGSDSYFVYGGKPREHRTVSLNELGKEHPRIKQIYQIYWVRFAENETAAKLLKTDWEKALRSRLFGLVKFILTEYPDKIFTKKQVAIALARKEKRNEMAESKMKGEKKGAKDEKPGKRKKKRKKHKLNSEIPDLDWLGILQRGGRVTGYGMQRKLSWQEFIVSKDVNRSAVLHCLDKNGERSTDDATEGNQANGNSKR